jgi:N4-gp56 family major capsid protein
MNAYALCRVEPGFGAKKGDRIKFDRVSKVATGGGKISESSEMPETKVTLSQGYCLVDEWGNSIPYTGKLEALSEFDPENITQKALKDDQEVTLDSAVVDTLKGCKIMYTPTGTVDSPSGAFATTGTVITAATRDTSTYDVKEIVDYMESVLWVPKVNNKYYVCLASQQFLRTIQDDRDFVEAVKYGRPEDLYAGEVGMYYGVRYLKQINNMATVLGTTAYRGEAIFLGDDAIVDAISIAAEIRAKIPGDYGRDKGVAWYAMEGFSLTYDTATPGEARVVYLTST